MFVLFNYFAALKNLKQATLSLIVFKLKKKTSFSKLSERKFPKQPIKKNILAEIAKFIANNLKLEDIDKFTSYSLKISSATA